MCDLCLKGYQALGIVCTYCQKLSLLEQLFGPLEVLYCKQGDCVFGKGSGHIEKSSNYGTASSPGAVPALPY